MKTGHILNSLLKQLQARNFEVTVQTIWSHTTEVLQDVRTDAGAPFLVTDKGVRIPQELDAIYVTRKYNRRVKS